MPNDKPPKGVIKIPSPSEPRTSGEPPPLRREPMRSIEELTPLARRISSNVELMKKFQEVRGSDNRGLGVQVIHEIWQFAQTIDPTVTYAESATVAVALMKIIGAQSEGKNG
jgi:hypothetical protein